ncbi:MAG: ferritin family protein [Azospirillaceae bacterium]|nr:ferritin family protein [Azospirillaceae bacterium]
MPLLRQEPAAAVASMDELLTIALMLEEEAARRYLALADHHSGTPELATLFQTLAEEEKRHADALAQGARHLSRHQPQAADILWRLPPEIAASWDAVKDSALLSPYTALSIAVRNEERTFAFYSYIAAHAATPEIARQAEALAQEELNHAARLRQVRRLAFHRERGTRPPLPTAADAQALRALAETIEAEIAVALTQAPQAARQAAERAVDIYAHALGQMADEGGIDLARDLLKAAVIRLGSLNDAAP